MYMYCNIVLPTNYFTEIYDTRFLCPLSCMPRLLLVCYRNMHFSIVVCCGTNNIVYQQSIYFVGALDSIPVPSFVFFGIELHGHVSPIVVYVLWLVYVVLKNV